jgi:signal transduction histidine kinase
VASISTRQIYWLTGIFITSVLVLLVAVPVFVSHRMTSIVSELNDLADPADRLGDEVGKALSRELAAILGFQATDQEQYSALYIEQTRIIDDAFRELEQLTPRLGPAVQPRFKELQSAVAHWHKDVHKNNLVRSQFASGEFRRLLFNHEYIYEASQQAAVNFDETVNRWRFDRRAGLQSLGHMVTILNGFFALLALAALALVLNTLRRLNASTLHLRERAKEEEALRQVAHSLTGALTLDDVLRRITETAALAGEAEMVFIETINSDKNEVTCVAAQGSDVPLMGMKGPYEGSIVKDVLSSGEPRIVDDIRIYRDTKSLFARLARACDNCAAMIVPLIADREMLGALFLVRRHPRYFTAAEFPRVKILADMASVAMQRALTLEQIRKMQAEEHFVGEAASILASSLDYNATLQSVVRLAVPRMADWCAVHTVVDGDVRLVEVAHADPSKAALTDRLREIYGSRRVRDYGAVRVIRTGKAELYSDVGDEVLEGMAHNEDHLQLMRELNMKSAMIVPLSAGGETLGSISFVSEETRRYNADDLRFAENIARHAGLAIQNSRLYASAGQAIRIRDDAIRARDEILRVVSHDLRNPVHNIQMTTKLLAAGNMSGQKYRQMVHIIQRAAERMNRLIEDLIAVARVREGQPIPLNLQPEDPREIVGEVCEVFDVQARSKGITLRCDGADGIPSVKADRHRILQVISNLVDNAIKFTPEGGTITVSCEAWQDRVRFAVRDTGRGIEQENLNRIFDLFWQAKTTAHMGAGMGLAIAKAIVEQHGGKIWVESQPGAGTTFFFTLGTNAG